MEEPYKTVAVPHKDIALVVTALELLFDQVAAKNRSDKLLEHIRDVHAFFARTYRSQ
jgi:hypothetical protein